MPTYKDEKKGTYYASFYYTDFTGAKRKKMKRGFERKRDAQEWERQFLLQRNADPDMRFGDFVEIYRTDIPTQTSCQMNPTATFTSKSQQAVMPGYSIRWCKMV